MKLISLNQVLDLPWLVSKRLQSETNRYRDYLSSEEIHYTGQQRVLLMTLAECTPFSDHNPYMQPGCATSEPS